MAIAKLGDTKEQDTPTELTDSDYPPVQGFTSAKKVAEASVPPNMPLLDKSQVVTVLNNEGYGVTQHQVQPLNFFPSPMDAFQYALYQFGITDVYIVLMINKRRGTIYGYHVLDLTQEYSLVDDIINRMKEKTALI